MKVIIVTSEDPFYVPVFFEHFFNLLHGQKLNVEIAGVVITDPLGNKTKLGLAKRMLGFYGLDGFLKQSIKYFFQKIGKFFYRKGLKRSSFSIEYYTNKAAIKLLPYKDINSREFVEFVKNNNIELISSVAASQIFKKEILEAPSLGCINIHNAPLPNYRGMLPNFWQMFHGEKFSIMSIHEMVEKLDMGRIILQEKTEILPEMTLDKLIRETKRKNAEALIKVWKMFVTGNVQYHDVPNVKGSYFTFPTKKDIIEFKKRGYKIM